MRRFILVFFWGLAFTSVCQGAISPKLEQQIIQNVDKSTHVVFSSAPINPEKFAHQHALSNAPAYVQQLCQVPGLHCVKIRPHEIWSYVFPNAQNRNIMMRLNRMNSALFYRQWLVVPTDWHHLNDLSFSPMPLYRNTHHHSEVVVSLSKYAFAAYGKDGRLVRWGPATSGIKQCPYNSQSCATPTGTFWIYRKAGADCRSNLYPISTHGGSPMPYCVFFHAGYSLHQSLMMGFINKSHGCVYLFHNDIKWLNEDFVHLRMPVIVEA
jgi:hypothetical protein